MGLEPQSLFRPPPLFRQSGPTAFVQAPFHPVGYTQGCTASTSKPIYRRLIRTPAQLVLTANQGKTRSLSHGKNTSFSSQLRH